MSVAEWRALAAAEPAEAAARIASLPDEQAYELHVALGTASEEPELVAPATLAQATPADVELGLDSRAEARVEEMVQAGEVGTPAGTPAGPDAEAEASPSPEARKLRTAAKLRAAAAGPADRGRILWRGMRNLRVRDTFLANGGASSLRSECAAHRPGHSLSSGGAALD
jgi:hypothetical protein